MPADPTTKTLEKIAADIAEVTDGKITADISFQALGTPGDYYDAVAYGLCDLAYVIAPYNPGRFSLVEGIMLPIAYPSNVVRVGAIYNLWQEGWFDDEYSEVHPVAVVNSVDFLFMFRGKTDVTTLAQMRGKKISAPSGVQTDMVEAIGAIPVSMPVSDLYMALETGVVDGACQGWPFIPVFKAAEVVDCAVMPARSGFPGILAINKGTWDKLPQVVKDLFNDKKYEYSIMQAKGFDAFNELGKKMLLDAGGRIYTLSDTDIAEMDKLYKPIFDDWVAAVSGQGKPAEDFLDRLYDELVSLGMEKPFEK